MIWCLLFLLINANALATMDKSYSDARDFMAEHPVTTDVIKYGNLQEIPGFAGGSPPEAAMYEQILSEQSTKIAKDQKSDILTEQSKQALMRNDAAQHLIETSNTRPRFTIDLKTDPLFNWSSVDPGITITAEPQGSTTQGMIEKTCEEGGEDISYECFENRIVRVNVPIKTVTLTVNHLEFSPTYRQERYVTKSGNFWRHTQYGTRNVLTGYLVSLPKEINKFKCKFCQGFTAKDVSTNAVFNIDCNKIVGFKINSGSITDLEDVFTITTGTNSLNITLEHKTYENEATDEWTGCNHFESMLERGLCSYGARVLTQGPDTRNINGYPIFKEDWQYKQTYNCKMIKDGCSSLRAQGCVQVGSHCKEYRQNKCWIYEQKYQCSNGKLSLSKIKSPRSGAFCLTGDCHDPSYQANGEMLDVISRLNLLKEVQDDIQNQNNSQGNFKIFQGHDHECSRNCLNFKDCCGGMNGWGVKFNLAGCKPEELKLADMRQKNLCHQVGETYCAKRDPVLKKCINKKTSFCCFGNKFAKILQVQGRDQLKLSWGNAKCPDCRALTIEELSRMDLSRMDFSELFEDVMKKYKSPDLNNLQEVTRKQMTENMKRMADGLKSNAGATREKDSF